MQSIQKQFSRTLGKLNLFQGKIGFNPFAFVKVCNLTLYILPAAAAGETYDVFICKHLADNML